MGLAPYGEPRYVEPIMRELMARTSRNWWVIPLVLVILALGAILALGNTALAPFIYTLF